MIKALASTALAAAAAFIIASPAAAAPICNDASDWAYAGTPAPGVVDYSLDTANFCDAAYEIVSINWSLGPWNVYQGYSTATLLNMYLGSETAVVTVTDGTDTDEFTVTVYPCYVGQYCPPF